MGKKTIAAAALLGLALRAAVLAGAGEKMEQRGFLSRALHALRRTGMQTDHYKAEVEKEPEARAQAGAAAMRAFLPEKRPCFAFACETSLSAPFGFLGERRQFSGTAPSSARSARKSSSSRISCFPWSRIPKRQSLAIMPACLVRWLICWLKLR